ncbi:hypothetical protein [Puia dinghuensis]|uniref:Uncharacterized protein n=1 Tax=Puia dinghuensis TaxID=1792502 RepID=A0A8J2UAL5_9BACT|nr:hypothetical protein [Puia dinghuensis]GGA89922.1 hypothetical protein GCM10011511_11450 [Puia dinghuensis]
MKNVQKFLSQLFQDKNGSYSLREIVVLLFIAVILVSWIARQFFGREVPEFMFYSFVSLVGAGVFGYSLEKKCTLPELPKADA